VNWDIEPGGIGEKLRRFADGQDRLTKDQRRLLAALGQAEQACRAGLGAAVHLPGHSVGTMLRLLTVRVANHADYMNNRCTACREGAETVTVIYQGGDREMELNARQGAMAHTDPMPFRLPPARGDGDRAV
jgi:hypothetical protein